MIFRIIWEKLIDKRVAVRHRRVTWMGIFPRSGNDSEGCWNDGDGTHGMTVSICGDD